MFKEISREIVNLRGRIYSGIYDRRCMRLGAAGTNKGTVEKIGKYAGRTNVGPVPVE